MYLRVKTRKNKSGNIYQYAYLAEIKQRKKSHPKQKVIKYLGRVYKFPKKHKISPQNTVSEYKPVAQELVRNELKNYDFIDFSPDILKKEDIEVNLAKLTVKNIKTNKDVCIQINQGFLCKETMESLLNYKPPRESMKMIRKHFAKTVVEAGVQATQPSIIDIFKQLQTMINNKQQPNNTIKI